MAEVYASFYTRRRNKNLLRIKRLLVRPELPTYTEVSEAQPAHHLSPQRAKLVQVANLRQQQEEKLKRFEVRKLAREKKEKYISEHQREEKQRKIEKAQALLKRLPSVSAKFHESKELQAQRALRQWHEDLNYAAEAKLKPRN